MKYSDLVDINKEFQASVNLEYDLNDIEKVKHYIPTEQSVEVLGKFLRSFYYGKEDATRASVLIGPYGRGKSHLLLILTALTSMDLFESENYTKEEARKVQLDLCHKIGRVNSEVGALAEAIVSEQIRTLPVIINSNFTEINQSFLIAIKYALERAGLDNLLPTTYFDAAVDMIDKWREGYPEAIETLSEELNKRKTTVEDIYIDLKQYNQQAYSIFCECYPLIAAGTLFNPLTNMDVVKLYISVTNELCEKTEYCGINIIFDEFGKFLEGNIENNNPMAFKIIQDMAEIAVRSKKEQIHFTCVTQKSILEYSSNINYKTIEGRFNQIEFVASSEQSYELIADAIPKKEAFDLFFNDHKAKFQLAIDSASIVNVFDELEPDKYEEKVVKGCFPLSPLSSFCLLHISELVGQNERTLFTFLTNKGEYSLPEYLKCERSRVEFVTVDQIYDYFEPLFKKEVFNSRIHSIWLKTDTAIRQTNNVNEINILKSIALISMIQDERYKPISAHIKSSLMLGDEEFDLAINHLLKEHILSQRDSSEYVLLTSNGVDVQKNVTNFVNSKLSRINKCDVLMREFPLGYVIPHEYNDRYGMLRYFKKIYMDADSVLSYQDGSSIIRDYPYDGLVIYVIDDNKTKRIDILNKAEVFKETPQIVFCISDLEVDLEEDLKKVIAIKELKNSELAKDPHYLEEIQLYEEDLRKQIKNVIDDMYAPSSKCSLYFNCDGQLNITRQTDLNNTVDCICLHTYCKTPVINNEMVNKSVLNSQNLKARNLVVDWLLSHSDDSIITCMDGHGPEVSIFKSMYTFTGLDRKNRVKDEGINSVLDIIEKFVMEAEEHISNFGDIYNVLQNAPYGVRKGIIPLFLVYVLRKYKEWIVIYFETKEVELSSKIIGAINDNPENYSLMLESGTKDREDMLNNLEKLFDKYIDINSNSANRVYSVAKSMQAWMLSLPEYSKKFTFYLKEGKETEIDSNTCIVRNDLLQFEINAQEMLFRDWPNKLNLSGNLNEYVKEIERIKSFLDNHINNFRNELICYLIDLFKPGYHGSLSNAVKLWYEGLSESTRHHIFDSEANSLLTLAQELTSFDDYELLNSLALTFVSMTIEDWNDQILNQFLSSISLCVETINRFISDEESDKGCQISITFHGRQLNKSFSNTEITPLGETALNNLKAVFDEYNSAIEPDEQLAILAVLINDLIH